MRAPLAIVRGGGDLATGTINRLFKSGFKIMVLEIACPTVIRRTVSGATAIFDGEIEVEGVRYVYYQDVHDAIAALDQNHVPVLVDPDMEIMTQVEADLFVDATIAKRNMGVHAALAKHVIGLGPGFAAPENCHAVIETSRGHNLGVIFYSGSAKANTGVPGVIMGFSEERIVRAPEDGAFSAVRKIGDSVKKGEILGYAGGKAVTAPLDGVLRGLIHEQCVVHTGMKIGDVDPRGNVEACWSISDKARALGGSVLEAYLHLSGGLRV